MTPRSSPRQRRASSVQTGRRRPRADVIIPAMAGCLTEDQLRGLMLGTLSVSDMRRVSEHTAQCARCESRCDELEDLSDPLIDRLRSAHTSKPAAADAVPADAAAETTNATG